MEKRQRRGNKLYKKNSNNKCKNTCPSVRVRIDLNEILSKELSYGMVKFFWIYFTVHTKFSCWICVSFDYKHILTLNMSRQHNRNSSDTIIKQTEKLQVNLTYFLLGTKQNALTTETYFVTSHQLIFMCI